MDRDDKKKHMTVKWEIPQNFRWSVGLHGSKFFEELKHKRIVGIKCPECGRVYLPPRKACGRCFVEMSELIPVGPQGIVEGYTVVRFPFIDPDTGKQRPVPYGYGFVKLDGADSYLMGVVDETDIERMHSGMKVEAVFAENRTGSITDLSHFRIVRE